MNFTNISKDSCTFYPKNSFFWKRRLPNYGGCLVMSKYAPFNPLNDNNVPNWYFAVKLNPGESYKYAYRTVITDFFEKGLNRLYIYEVYPMLGKGQKGKKDERYSRFHGGINSSEFYLVVNR